MSRIPDFIENISTSESTGSRLATALESYMQAAERDEPIDRDTFLAHHEELADELRRCLESLDFIHHASLGTDSFTVNAESPSRQHLLGDFRLLGEIGRGGMGVVYEAEQLSLERHVAVKVLPFAALLDPRQLARFKNEARAAAMLKHPHIVSIFSVGCERGVHFYAMELVEGLSLADILRENIVHENQASEPPPTHPTNGRVGGETQETEPVAALSTQRHDNRQEYFRSVARLGIQAAQAIDYAHREGVIHRDIKPSNLMLDRAANLLVTDFGLARIHTAEDLTVTGDVLGTLRYMSPEQLDSTSVVDERTDVYSLGITLYELVCSQPAFAGTSRQEIEQKIVAGQISKPRSVDPLIPRDLETILLKAAALERDRRYRSAGELGDDLQRFLSRQPIQAQRVSTWEQIRSWVRRNRRIALLSTTVALLLVLIASSASLLAVKFARDARRLKLSAHAQTIRLAQREIDHGSHEAAERELLRLVPVGDEEDLRGFPWYWLWDACHTRAAKQIIRHNLGVGSLAWSVDSRQLASNSWSRLYVNDLLEQKTVWEARTDAAYITAIARIGPADDLVTGDSGGQVTFWNSATGEKRKSILIDVPPKEAWIYSISESVDGRFLAISASDTTLYGAVTPGHVWVWDTRKNEFVHKISNDLEGRVYAAFTPNYLVMTSSAGRLLAFDIDTWQQREKQDCRGMVTRLAVSSDGRLVATASATGHGMDMRSHIDLWETDPWRRISTISPHDKPIRALAFNHDGTLLAAGDITGRLAMVEVATTHIVKNQEIHADAIFAIAFSPDGQQFATGSSDNTVRVWDLERFVHPPPGWSTVSSDHVDRIHNSALLDNGHTIASVDNSGRLLVWNATTDIPPAEFSVECANMTHARLSVAADRKLIGVSRFEWPFHKSPSVMEIFDVSDLDQPKFQQRVPLPRGVVYCRPAFSPDARTVAIGSNEHVVVYSTTTGQLVTELPDEYWVKCVAWSPDGKWLVAGGGDERAKLYRTSDWRLVNKIPTHTKAIEAVAFAPNSSCFATGGMDGIVKLWSLPAGKPVGPSFKPIENWILNIQFSPDGRHILTTSKDGMLRIWLRESGDELLAIRFNYGWLDDGTFSADGKSIIVGVKREIYLLRSSIDELARLSLQELEAYSCQPDIQAQARSKGDRE